MREANNQIVRSQSKLNRNHMAQILRNPMHIIRITTNKPINQPIISKIIKAKMNKIKIRKNKMNNYKMTKILVIMIFK